MSIQTIICLFIFVAILVAFALNKLPIAITAMIGMTLMVITGCLEPTDAIASFASTTVMQIGAMRILAGAFNRTRVIGQLASFVSRISKGSVFKVLVGYVILGAVLQSFIYSALATFTLLYPLMLACCKEMRISPSKIMFPVSMVCICCGSALPTSGAINMIAVLEGYLI